jgi:eukaryotic-like serine/threonine-protein kinase
MLLDVLGLVGSTVGEVRFDACVDGGGFGVVYRGRHLGLEELVAIKCMRISSMQRTTEGMRESLAARFRDETKILYRLSQGNLDIVRCLGSGTLVAPATGEVTPYMILEWLEGRTLGAELRERRELGVRPRSLEEAVALLDPAFVALAYAHSHEVVHRDVKPGNLFLAQTREGVRVKVLDFGLAKILEADALGVRPSVETGVGVHFCSPSYGALEQFSPDHGPVGPWTDVYSLALLLLEVMKGDKVRPASSLADGLIKALHPATGSPRASSLGLSLPPAVEDVLARAVARNPLERPRDAGVFRQELREAMADARAPAARFGRTVADVDVEAAMARVRAMEAAASRPVALKGTLPIVAMSPLAGPLASGPVTPRMASAPPLMAPGPAMHLRAAQPSSHEPRVIPAKRQERRASNVAFVLFFAVSILVFVAGAASAAVWYLTGR